MHLKWAFSGAHVQRIISKVYRSYHETRSELLRIKKKKKNWMKEWICKKISAVVRILGDWGN